MKRATKKTPTVRDEIVAKQRARAAARTALLQRVKKYEAVAAELVAFRGPLDIDDPVGNGVTAAIYDLDSDRLYGRLMEAIETLPIPKERRDELDQMLFEMAKHRLETSYLFGVAVGRTIRSLPLPSSSKPNKWME